MRYIASVSVSVYTSTLELVAIRTPVDVYGEETKQSDRGHPGFLFVFMSFLNSLANYFGNTLAVDVF